MSREKRAFGSALIIGLGLIGGSLAKGLAAAGITAKAVDRDPSSIAAALADGVICAGGTSPTRVLCDVDCVLVCTPVGALASVFRMIHPLLPDRASVFDCASVNALPCRLAAEEGLARFASLHPMAGSEKGGYAAARAHLFENAYIVTTPCALSDAETLARAAALTRMLRGIPVSLDAETHDRYAGVISHLPHIAAASLVNLMDASADSSGTLAALAAGGFRDITRISSSSPALWSEISLANRAQLLPLLARYTEELERFRIALEDGDRPALEALFSSAKHRRDSMENRPFGVLGRTFGITLDIQDTVGALAKITRLLGDAGINICNIGIINSRESEGGVLKIALSDAESRRRACALLAEAGYPAAHADD